MEERMRGYILKFKSVPIISTQLDAHDNMLSLETLFNYCRPGNELSTY